MKRDPTRYLDAAHHLLWLAGDGNGGKLHASAADEMPPADTCATLAWIIDPLADDATDDVRALGYARAAVDLLLLAETDDPDGPAGKAAVKALKALRKVAS